MVREGPGKRVRWGSRRYAPRPMNENIVILIVALVAVNLILITVAVVRSMRRKDPRRSRRVV